MNAELGEERKLAETKYERDNPPMNLFQSKWINRAVMRVNNLLIVF